MKWSVAPHILGRFLGIALLGAAFAVNAAQLDFVADAVLGKAAFTTPSGGLASASNTLSPGQLAEDPITGALWVTDFSASRVLRFSSAAAFANGEAANLVLGQADFTSSSPNRGGAAAANTLAIAMGVAVDQAGRVYVADTYNNRILIYRPPQSNGMDATWVVGQADFTAVAANRGGSPAADRLSNPRGLALNPTGNLLVADYGNNRVLRYNAPAITGSSANQVFGQPDFTTNAAATTATGLSFPNGLALDSSGNLWVTEEGNHRVLRFSNGADFGFDTTADNVLCQGNFTTSATGTTASSCRSPVGVAVDHEGVVYVSDSDNSRILRFIPPYSNGMAATAVIGQPDFTSNLCNRGFASPSDTTLCQPYPPVFDREGNLLVAENGNGRVLRFDLPRIRIPAQLASLSPELVPVGGGAFTLTVNGFRFYQGSVVNWNGSPRATAFITDRRILAQITAADVAGVGPFSVTVTTPTPGGGVSGPLAFSTYVRAALDEVADRVLGQYVLTSALPINGQVGEEQLGLRNRATFTGGRHAAVDRVSGRLFVADTGASRVMSWPSVSSLNNAQSADVILGKLDEFSVGCNTDGLGASSMCGAFGVAVDAAGALYVSDDGNNRVLRFTPPFSTGMAATGVFGQGGVFTTNAVNKGGLGAASLNRPKGIAVNDGALFVQDSENRRILVYQNPAGDSTADAVIGQPDMTSALVEASSSTRFASGDGGLALDASGRLHFANSTENRVLRFSPPFTNGMAADLVLGQPDFVSTAPATSASRLRTPIGIAVDPGGSVLVAEYDNNRVVRFAAPISPGMAATGLLGQFNFATSTSGANAAQFFRPIGLAFDTVGNLFVVDSANSRVFGFDRPFAFPLDPATDLDGDGIPNGVEVTESRDPYVKDNDIFAAGAPGPRLFAMQQYRDFLGREGDAGGITYYTNLLASGAAVRANVIESFFNSPEFSGTVSPIVRLYFAFFNRIPDYPGLQFQVNAFRAGTPLTVIANNFSLSPEFVATYGALTNTQYVTLLYQNVLGRTPVQAEIDYHVNRLNTGVTRGEVMAGFSESPEYIASSYNKVYVTMMYVGMLRRSPEQAGFDYWLAYMTAGNPGLNLILGFLNAPEYRNRFLP